MSKIAELKAPAGKRALSKAANRDAILLAAKRVFASAGFEATTVRDIIRETKLASGTFYNYFKSKEEVFDAIADESAKSFRHRLKDVRQQATDFESYIRIAYRAYFQFLVEEHRETLREVGPHIALIGARVDTPEMQAVFEEIRMDMESVMARSGMDHIDPEYMAAAAIGIARDLGEHMLRRTPVDVEGASEFVTALVLAGVKGLAQTD